MANDNNWGGKREGAGAKKKYTRRYTFSATKRASELIDNADNKAEFINKCIERSAE